MDDRGRFARSLNWLRDNLWPAMAAEMRLIAAGMQKLTSRRTALPTDSKASRQANRRSREARHAATRIGRMARRLRPLAEMQFPRGSGAAASVVLVLAFAGYGVAKGGHVPTIVGQLKDARDAAANAVGFRIASIALGGQKHVSR